MNLEPAPWAENPDAFTQEAVDTYIQNLAGQLTAATETKTSLETQLAEATKTSQETQGRLDELTSKLAETETSYQALTQLRAKEQALLAAGLPVDLADLLPAAEGEVLDQAVAKLAALKSTQDSKPFLAPADPSQAAQPATDPRQEMVEAIFGSS